MPSASVNEHHKKLDKQNCGSAGSGFGSAIISAGEEQQSTMSEKSTSTVECSTNNEPAVDNNNGIKDKITASGAVAALASDSSNPMRQALITIEHKIRNLEKRKTKLESYRAIQATGKELSGDQKAAVAKYDAVMATLDFARDLSKQMLQFAKDAEKEQKKQLRKENILKAQAETTKIREVLVIQNILSCFSDESIRIDFAAGENGAVKLEQADLEAIEKFCFDIQTRRPESTDDVAFLTAVQKAAENFSMTIDGRPKQFCETTYEHLRKVFNQIQACGYLDKIYIQLPAPIVEANQDEDLVDESDDVNEEDISLVDEQIEKLDSASGNDIEAENSEQQEFSFMGNDSDDLQQQQQQSFDMQPQQQQHQQHDQVNEHLDIQHQQHQIHSSMPTQQQTGMQGPHATAPGGSNFQQQQSALQPSQPGTTTTPVHVAMYTPQQLQAQPQPNSAQLQQVATGGIINVQQVPPQMVATGAPPHQRQMVTSPAGGQIPQGGHLPMHAVSPVPGHFPPTTVRAVEQTFFKQHQHQHAQYMQHMRPLAEVIGGGSFYFLQDSELDSPELTATTGPVGTVVFESQQPQQLHQQPSQTNVLTNDTLQKTQDQQQMIVNNIQQQPIPTQTFTNQSFPPLQQHLPQQAPPQHSVGAATFQPKLFSPVAAVGIQHQQLIQQQDVVSNAQQPQQQYSATVTNNMPNIAIDTVSPIFQQKQLFSPGVVQQQSQPQEIATNVLQQQQQLPLPTKSPIPNQNSGGGISNNNNQTRKNDWSTTADNGSYVEESADCTSNETNHWNTNQPDNANSGGYGRGRGPNNYQRRGGDRDDRRERPTGGYRGRSNNYSSGNNSSQHQQNGGRGGNGSGIYFRNNENGSTGSSYYQNGSGSGGGGGYTSNKEAGGSRYDSGGGGNNYRGPRGNVRGNGPPSRAMGRNTAGGGGPTNSSSSSSYVNATRQSNRMPQIGLDNKN